MDVTTKSLEITLAPSILGPEVAKLSAEERLVLIEAFARRAMADGRLPQTENELGSGSTGVAKLTPRQALALDLLAATAVAANVDADALDAAIPKDAVFAATVALVSSTVSSTVSARESSKEPSTTTRLLALHAALVVKHHSAFSRSRCVSAAASIAAALESNSNSNLSSNLNDDGPRRRDLALMFFETRDFAKALIHFNKLKQLNYAVPERDLQRLETIHAICRKLAASSSNSTASAPSTPKQPNTSVPNTPSSSFASLSSPLLSLAAFRARNDYGPAFITLILNDWKDRVIPLQLRTKVLPDFLYLSHPDCALKLSFLNALFEAVDYDLASTLSRKQSVQSNSSNFSLSNSKSVSDSQNTYTDDAVFGNVFVLGFILRCIRERYYLHWNFNQIFVEELYFVNIMLRTWKT
ncbi:hypothetical protein BCR33DRAFT_717988 [Rhizoclosmatium globosum]|uniref:Uncharacterized protein n=1 Tax=Rhizoclosmatium globosum TaxID=329046 RepID=A0A1Y2C8Y1_9FUNG|nr:hypothetical protein BCR33DRAFT_717988 [Rhizoclosmatium globosum]|eukprot:ORY42785.1 hypothetical protein BCR33DRAFT_717988 [Rhizoclosmatium globosum]